MEKDMSYRKALAEVEEILIKIQNEELDVDELAGKLKRVSELISFCKVKLKNADKEVQKILDDMED